MRQLTVNLPGREYHIDVGTGIWREKLPQLLRARQVSQAIVVTNETLHQHYPDWLAQELRAHGLDARTCRLPDGEQYKSLATLEQIYDFLLSHAANRKTWLIAFGGGVVGDITGFAAATFMRGIPFVQVPTTLLADVDSSVGGKTAVNHPRGKNMVGAFKQPEYVCIDLDFLRSLPKRELWAGYFELAKHGFIHDPSLFEFLQTRPLEPLDPHFLEEAITRSCDVKRRVVEQDEKESGLRATLNFGHTLGHLIEAHAGYGTYLHGEAVGTGMLFATYVSQREGHLSADTAQRIVDFLLPLVPQVQLKPLTEAAFTTLLLHDKKAENQAINFILLRDLGECFIQKSMDTSTLWQHFQQFLQEYPQACAWANAA
jgi:3-dehydroquinate synthase